MSDNKIRTIVVDDSVVVRGLLAQILENEPDIEVTATAANGQMALSAISRNPVDVVILDIEMPVMDGLTALPLILKANPRVRVIMASTLTERGAEIVLKALSLGAADYLHKPSTGRTVQGIHQIAGELLRKVRALGNKSQAEPEPAEDWRPICSPIWPGKRTGSPRVLAVGASTGGPNALARFLRDLGADFRLPILVVQHMPPIFTRFLAERFGNETKRESAEGVDGEVIKSGKIYVAPGGRHMVVAKAGNSEVIQIHEGPPENHCRPAVDPLFRSVAQAYGGDAIAVVLTGMGEDGKKGAEMLVKNGVKVLVQDRETSIVWGMPGAIAKAGLASAVLPLDKLAASVQEELKGA